MTGTDDKQRGEEWVVYVVEALAFGGPVWLFWRAEIGEWVSALARATRYPTVGAARAVAGARAAADEVEARVILADQIT